MSTCLAVASGKGGAGKSTVAAGIGAALADTGSRVVVIDTDTGLRSLDALLSLENRVVYDLIDLLKDRCSLDEALLNCEAFPNLYLLPAAQFKRVKALEPPRFQTLLQDLRRSFDWILIDCPAGIERGFRAVLRSGVDQLILVSTADDLSLRCAERAAQVARDKGFTSPYLILNRMDPALIRSGEMMTASAAALLLDLPLLAEIPEDPMVRRALLRHTPLLQCRCEAELALRRAAARLRGENLPFPQYGRRGRLFSLFYWLRRLPEPREVIPLERH